MQEGILWTTNLNTDEKENEGDCHRLEIIVGVLGEIPKRIIEPI